MAKNELFAGIRVVLRRTPLHYNRGRLITIDYTIGVGKWSFFKSVRMPNTQFAENTLQVLHQKTYGIWFDQSSVYKTLVLNLRFGSKYFNWGNE